MQLFLFQSEFAELPYIVPVLIIQQSYGSRLCVFANKTQNGKIRTFYAAKEVCMYAHARVRVYHAPELVLHPKIKIISVQYISGGNNTIRSSFSYFRHGLVSVQTFQRK
jgi:hypothetical protein